MTAESVTVTITENDAVGVAIAPTSLTVTEGDATGASYTVVLDSQPTADVTVTVSGHAGTDVSLDKTSLTFTPENWETPQTVTVDAAEDADALADPAVTLAHAVAGAEEYAAVSAGDIPSVTVTIDEDDAARVSIDPTTLTVPEGGDNSYTVVLDTQPGADVVVTVSGHIGTDLSLSGQTLTNDELTFTPANWNQAQTVTVTADQDDDAAADPAVTLSHTVSGAVEYAAISAGDIPSVTVTIDEDDSSTLSVSAARAAEDAGYVVFEVDISPANDQEVTVNYATSDGTATAGQDYTAANGTLTFPANSAASQSIRVAVTDDEMDEDDETFTLTLSQASMAALAGGGETLAATGTITDNDDPQVTVSFGDSSYTVTEGDAVEVTVTLSADPEREVTIPINETENGASSDDYSVAPRSLSFASGETSKSFTFTANDDRIDDDGESVDLAFGALPDGVSAGGLTPSATVTITDDDMAGVSIDPTELSVDEGGNSSYTVVLDTQPSADVTVAVSGHAGTDLSLSGQTLTNDELTFTPVNWNAAQSVTVTAGQDDDAAADAAVTLSHAVSGAVEYAAISAEDIPSVTVTIDEDDEAGVSVNPTTLTVLEGSTASYTVVLTTQPSADVSVTISGHSGSDVSLGGPTLSAETLTFTPVNWNIAQTVTVSAAQDDDAAADPAETLSHTVSGAVEYAAISAGDIPSVTVTIDEDDSSTLSVSAARAAEDAGYVVFEVDISPANDQEVTVNYATSDGTATAGQDYTAADGTLTFPANSVASQSIRVAVTDDEMDEDDETFTLTLSQASVAALAGGGETLAAIGTITDNDAAGVSIDPTELSVDEGGNSSYTVVLDTQPSADVTVTVSGHAGTDITVSGTTLNSNNELIFTPRQLEPAPDGDGLRRPGRRRGCGPGRDPEPHRQRGRGVRRDLCRGHPQRHRHHRRGRLIDPVGQRRPSRRGCRIRGVRGGHQPGQRPGGDGELCHLRRHRNGGAGLHRRQWNADIPGQLRSQPEHQGGGDRRRDGRGRRDLHADPEPSVGGGPGRGRRDPGRHRDHHRQRRSPGDGEFRRFLLHRDRG